MQNIRKRGSKTKTSKQKETTKIYQFCQKLYKLGRLIAKTKYTNNQVSELFDNIETQILSCKSFQRDFKLNWPASIKSVQDYNSFAQNIVQTVEIGNGQKQIRVFGFGLSKLNKLFKQPCYLYSLIQASLALGMFFEGAKKESDKILKKEQQFKEIKQDIDNFQFENVFGNSFVDKFQEVFEGLRIGELKNQIKVIKIQALQFRQKSKSKR